MTGAAKSRISGYVPDVIHCDDTTRDRSRDARREMLEACTGFGASVLTVFAGDHPEWSYDEKLEELEDFFGPLIQLGGEIGATIAVARRHRVNFGGKAAIWTELRHRFLVWPSSMISHISTCSASIICRN